jgi:DNA-directed RNA polymerase subunit RPC12/RpoP
MAFKHYKYFIDREPLMQFACFECRKSFKRKLGRETYACPQCGKEMCEMGRQFKAPRLDDVKQWRKVEALVRGGITFHSQRLHSLRNMPKVLREVAPFIRRVRTPID